MYCEKIIDSSRDDTDRKSKNFIHKIITLSWLHGYTHPHLSPGPGGPLSAPIITHLLFQTFPGC